MHVRRKTARRFVALGLAYLLALQAVLAAWMVVAPASAGAASGVICAAHDDAGPPSDQRAIGCLCGPLCLAGGAAACGPNSESGQILPLPPAGALAVWSMRHAPPPLRFATAPKQARAPPTTA